MKQLQLSRKKKKADEGSQSETSVNAFQEVKKFKNSLRSERTQQSCVCVTVIYRDAVPGAVGPVRPGEGDVIRGPAPGEEGAGEPHVRAHQGVALPAGVNSDGLGLLRHWETQISSV